MKIKTSELIDGALDLAVAVASGRWERVIRDEHRPLTAITDIGKDHATGRLMVYVPGPIRGPGCVLRDPYIVWSPSTDWSQGGPIIEREKISSEHKFFPEGWECRNGRNAFARGPTPLIAAMRCFVASKLGDEVDMPEELLA